MPDQFGTSPEGLVVAAGCLTSWSAGAVAGKLAAVLQAIDDHHGQGDQTNSGDSRGCSPVGVGGFGRKTGPLPRRWCVRLYFQFWVFSCAAVGRFVNLSGPEIVTPCPAAGGPVDTDRSLAAGACGLPEQPRKGPDRSVRRRWRPGWFSRGCCWPVWSAAAGHGKTLAISPPAPSCRRRGSINHIHNLKTSKFRDGLKLPAACHP